ncbi:MAG: DUF4476 domain-containing protein [Bacteroidales bacterium]|nr:DUF4476 domain-containing protein [Bacteroidales bacterium]
MKRVLLFVSLTLAVWGLQAQQAFLAFQSAHHEKFWVYIEGHEQNKTSLEAIHLSDLRADVRYSIRIVMDNKRRNTFTNTLSLHTGTNNYIVECNARTGEVSLVPTKKTIYSSVSHPVTGLPKPNQPGHPGDNHGQPNQPGHPGDNHGKPNQPGHPGDHHDKPGHPGDHHDKPGHPGDHHGEVHQSGHHENHVERDSRVEVVVVNPTPQPTPPPAPAFCSEPDFLAAKSLIAAEKFESNKLDLAKQVVRSEIMTTNQLVEIARLFTYESSKLEFLKFAYDYCYDKNKYYTVNSVFTYSSSKDEMNEFLRGR